MYLCSLYGSILETNAWNLFVCIFEDFKNASRLCNRNNLDLGPGARDLYIYIYIYTYTCKHSGPCSECSESLNVPNVQNIPSGSVVLEYHSTGMNVLSRDIWPVEVYGLEWSYGFTEGPDGIYSCIPKTNSSHQYTSPSQTLIRPREPIGKI